MHPATNPVFVRLDKQFEDCCAPVKFQKHKILFVQGTPIPALYLVLDGALALKRISPDGSEVLIGIMKSGELLGECELVVGIPASATACAITETTVRMIPTRMLRPLFNEPAFCLQMLYRLAQKLADAHEHIEILGCVSASDRIHAGLQWLADRAGIKTPHGIRIDLTVSEMSQAVRCARERLSRAISAMRRGGQASRLDHKPRELYLRR